MAYVCYRQYLAYLMKDMVVVEFFKTDFLKTVTQIQPAAAWFFSQSIDFWECWEGNNDQFNCTYICDIPGKHVT